MRPACGRSIRTGSPIRSASRNRKTLRGGIEFADDGEPLAYHVRSGHPGDRYAMMSTADVERIPRATEWGRPVFVHGFEPEREDQSRAVTPFAALMTRLRMIGKFADTELASATVNALFAAFLKSNIPVGEATQAFSRRRARPSRPIG
jgi:capsid protein